MPSRVRVVEVGPRDGLQDEAAIVSVDAKVALIEPLADAGLTSIEAGSFVPPRWVPQMANIAAVLARLLPRPGLSYPVLVPNLQGLAAPLQAVRWKSQSSHRLPRRSRRATSTAGSPKAWSGSPPWPRLHWRAA